MERAQATLTATTTATGIYGKKALGLNTCKQKNNFMHASRFLYISLPSLHCETAYIELHIL